MPDDLDERILQRKAQRFEILQYLYRRRLQGDDGCEAEWIAQGLQMDLDITIEHLDFLAQQGLARTVSGSETVAALLTHAGQIEVERVRMGQATPEFPAQIQNYIHVGQMHQSQIQQGTESSTATFNLSIFDANRARFENLLRSLRSGLAEPGLDPALRADLERDLTAAEAQVKAPRPNSGVLKELFKSLRSIVERASSTLLANHLPEIIALTDMLG